MDWVKLARGEEPHTYTGEMAESVDELALSVRSSNCLLNENIRLVGDIYEYGARRLLRLPNFGRKSLADVRGALEEKGLPYLQ